MVLAGGPGNPVIKKKWYPLPCSVYPICTFFLQPYRTTAPSSHDYRSYLEPEPSHTTPVLVDGALAVFLRVGRCREEHALVALGFLVFTYAAWLHHSSVQPIDQSERKREKGADLGLGSRCV